MNLKKGDKVIINWTDGSSDIGEIESNLREDLQLEYLYVKTPVFCLTHIVPISLIERKITDEEFELLKVLLLL